MMETTIQIIKELGFPIGAFLLMWWTNERTLNNMTKAFRDLVEEIKKK